MPGNVNRNRHRNSFFETLYPNYFRHRSPGNPAGFNPASAGPHPRLSYRQAAIRASV